MNKYFMFEMAGCIAEFFRIVCCLQSSHLHQDLFDVILKLNFEKLIKKTERKIKLKKSQNEVKFGKFSEWKTSMISFCMHRRKVIYDRL